MSKESKELSANPLLQQTHLLRSLKETGKATEMRDLLEEASRPILTLAHLELPSIPPTVDVKKEMAVEERKLEHCTHSQSMAYKKSVKDAQHMLEQQQQRLQYKEQKLRESLGRSPSLFTDQTSDNKQNKEQFTQEYEQTKRTIQEIKNTIKGENHV